MASIQGNVLKLEAIHVMIKKEPCMMELMMKYVMKCIVVILRGESSEG